MPHIIHWDIQENEFRVTPPAENIFVKINGTDVIQILLNLSVNAFQCTPHLHRVEVGAEILHAPLNLAEFKDGPNDRLLNVIGWATTGVMAVAATALIVTTIVG